MLQRENVRPQSVRICTNKEKGGLNVKTGAKLHLCAFVTVIMLLLAGCGTADSGVETEPDKVPAVTQQETQMPTEAEDDHKPGEADGFVHSYPLGTTVAYDLNGDGTEENITVNAQEYADGKLTIGSTSAEFMAVNPTGYFTVVNVDQSQNFLLVGISDYGFSDDNVTALFAYDGAQIAEVGHFEDVLGANSYDLTGATCHGDGTISARVRLDVLGTWTAMGLYRMGEAGLEDHTELYRRMDWEDRFAGWEVTTKTELTMYADSTQTSGQVTVPAGTMVRMTGIKKGPRENTHWAYFEVDALDEDLWLLTEEIEWQTFVCSGEKLLDSEEAFDGFFYAG